jgi:hypothetical protein
LFLGTKRIIKELLQKKFWHVAIFITEHDQRSYMFTTLQKTKIAPGVKAFTPFFRKIDFRVKIGTFIFPA